MKKLHRLNLRIDSRTYEQLKKYAEKNTFQQLSEGVRKLLKEALSNKMEFAMVLEPKNKWIEIELSFDKKEEKQESIVALPEDYRPAQKPYKAVSVVSDPEASYKHGDVIVVPTHVIQEIEIRDNKFYLVERNYIMATVR